jgi:hypothetical protein
MEKLDCNFTIEADEKGFSINCDIEGGGFEQSMIPSVVLYFMRKLCREYGFSLESALHSSLQQGKTLPHGEA